MAEERISGRLRQASSAFSWPLLSELNHTPEAKKGAALIDHIYMDAMGFGMGCSCLQITFQACNITEARRLYDALIPVAPLMVSNRPLTNMAHQES